MSTDSKKSERDRWCKAWEQDTKAGVLWTTYMEYACQRRIEQNGDWEEIGSSSLHPALLCRTVPGGLLAEQHTTQLKLADLSRVLERTSSSLLGGPGLIVSLLSLHSLPALARQLQFPHGRDLCKEHSAGWSPHTITGWYSQQSNNPYGQEGKPTKTCKENGICQP